MKVIGPIDKNLTSLISQDNFVYIRSMKCILYVIFLFASMFSIAQKEDFESGVELYDTSEEIVQHRKTSITIGKCCQLGKAMSKLSGGMFDVYLV